MSPRRPDPTIWVWCVLALSSGPAWGPESSVAVRTPQNIPSIIETQAKFFQDFFSVQLSPYKIEFGHVCEDPNTWEQRYEKKDFKNHRDMGKVRWGDKNGGYGEHYWDLNHAGHTGNQEDDEYDDSDYNEELQDYPETSEKSNIDREEYYPDASEYERSARPKRENSKAELGSQIGEKNYENDRRTIKQQSNTKPTQIMRYTDRKENFNIDLKKMPFRENMQKYMRESRKPSNNEYIVQANDYKIKGNYENPVRAELRNFEHYKDAPEKRFNRQVAPVLVSRLFFKSSAGNVIDRGTGQRYVLKPVNLDSRY